MAKRRTKPKAPATIADLKAQARNPRSITDGAAAGLGRSMGRFGDLSGITFNVRNGTLVTGHQRVEQLRAKYGDELIIEAGRMTTPDGDWPVRVVDWDQKTHDAAMVAANNQAIQGEWTDELQAMLAEIHAGDATLYDDLLLDELTKPPPRDVDVDEADDPPEQAFKLVVTCGSKEDRKKLSAQLKRQGFKCKSITT